MIASNLIFKKMDKIIDKVALIHINDYKVLSTISKNKAVFFFPGGKERIMNQILIV